MRTVYKYKIQTTDICRIRVPKLNGTDSFKEQILNIDIQNGEPCLWCLVDVGEEEQDIALRIVGTGNPMPTLTKDDYLGSYMLFNGGLVFHVFLEKERR